MKLEAGGCGLMFRIPARNKATRNCWYETPALSRALGRQQTVVQHIRSLRHGAVADALATVRASQASVTTKRAFEFLVLTAARSGEVRLATWDEMDMEAGVWTIPPRA